MKKITKMANGKALTWTTYDVDANGKLNRMTHYNGDGESGYSTFVYKKGKIVKENWYANVNGGLHGVAKYKYNSDGNVTIVKGASGSDKSTSKYTYDASGRLISWRIDRSDGSSDDEFFFYDNDGYLVRTSSSASVNTVDYIYETVSPTHKTKKK